MFHYLLTKQVRLVNTCENHIYHTGHITLHVLIKHCCSQHAATLRRTVQARKVRAAEAAVDAQAQQPVDAQAQQPVAAQAQQAVDAQAQQAVAKTTKASCMI